MATSGWEYVFSLFPILAQGISTTLQISLIASALALIIGLIVALITYLKIPILNQIAQAYLYLIRGTPVATQLYFFYYGLAVYFATIRSLPATIAVAIVMSISSGAFMSESIRAALESVDHGQLEAGLSLGMTRNQIIGRIVIPQALKVAIPTLINELINLVKMSSLSFMLGVPDLMGVAKIEGARTYNYFAVYGVVMAYYLLIISVIYLIQIIINKRLQKVK